MAMVGLLPGVIEKKGITLRGTPLYLDMQATTPMDPRVLDAMLPYMMEQVGSRVTE
jgi:cysteine desulfurase